MARKDASTWIAAEVLLSALNDAAGQTGSAVEIASLPERPMGLLVILGVGADADEVMDVVIEGSNDGGTTWTQAGAFAQATQPDGAQLLKADLDAVYREYRAVSTTGGTTPDFSYSVLLVGDKLAQVGAVAGPA